MLDKTHPTTEAVAKMAYDEAGGNVEKATAIMVSRVDDDVGLYRQLMNPLLREACYDAVRRVCRQHRDIVWNGRLRSRDEEGAAVEGKARGVFRESLYNFPLPSGKSLGDAVKAEVESAALFYHSQAADMNVKGTFLALVAKGLAANPTEAVRIAMTEKRLESLREKAENMK